MIIYCLSDIHGYYSAFEDALELIIYELEKDNTKLVLLGDYIFTEKYPAELGEFYEDYKIVAGHIGTAEISEDSTFHNIFFDRKSHYYIDSTVQDSGFLNILKVDTQKQKYYEVTEKGEFLIKPYTS